MIAKSIDYVNRYGGAAKHTVELSKALQNLGCDVKIASLETVESLQGLRNWRHRRIMHPPLDIIYLNARLSSITERFDIIHSQSRDGFFFCMNKRVPFIVTMHGLTSYRLRSLTGSTNLAELTGLMRHPSALALAALEWLVCVRSDRIIATSNLVASRLADWKGVRRDMISVIPNGVDVQRFNPNIPGQRTREFYNLTGPIILCVSRLDEDRSVGSLVQFAERVFHEQPLAHLVIVGEGPLRSSLEARFRERGIADKVVFAGGKTDDELPFVYAAADVCVLPTAYQVPELTMLEAMASGKPVIFLQNRACLAERDFVDGQNIVVAKSLGELADSCVQLLREEGMRRRIGQAARATVEKSYSWTAIALRTLNVYQSLLNN
jgi:glycosyltransferase involved in cell wall biosynthesis